VTERHIVGPFLRAGLAAGCFCALGLFARSVTLPMGFGDAERYYKMAESPEVFIGSPWGYRVAVPYLARFVSDVLGISIEIGFAILQIGFYCLFLWCLISWTQNAFRVSRFVAGLAGAMFVFSYPGVYNLHNFVHVGLSEHLLVLVGCMALTDRRFRGFVLIVAVSCFVKESVGLLLVPSAFVFLLATEKRRVALTWSAVTGAVYVFLTIFIRSGWVLFRETDLSSYSSFYSVDYLKWVFEYWGGVRGAMLETVVLFGPLLILVIVGFLIAPRQLKMLSVLPVLATSQIVLATDVGRMIGVGIPVLCALAAVALNRVDRGFAAVLATIPCGHFLCVNHGVDAMASLAGFSLITLGVLWSCRAQLTVDRVTRDS